MTPQHQRRQLLAGRGETHAAVRLVLGEPRLRQRLHHRRRRPRRDVQRRRHLSHRNEADAGRQGRLSLVDGFQVVLDRARREHAAILSMEPMPLLRDRIATPEGKRQFVRSLFATIADRYDLITVVLSYAQDQRWKRRLADLASPAAGARALDLATGTGDIALLFAARRARVVGLDVTLRMIELARRKAAGVQSATFLVGDMLALPFTAASFDIVTTGTACAMFPIWRAPSTRSCGS